MNQKNRRSKVSIGLVKNELGGLALPVKFNKDLGMNM
jgi:hypothetical protein